jgi:hypothetical protein
VSIVVHLTHRRPQEEWGVCVMRRLREKSYGDIGGELHRHLTGRNTRERTIDHHDPASGFS